MERVDLGKFYKRVITCRLCHKEYGSDLTKRCEDGVCPECHQKLIRRNL